VGGVISIALRWIASGYQPPIDSAVDSALRLGAVLATGPRAARLS